MAPESGVTADTSRDWSRAFKYILGRKRAEEALGFLTECTRTLAGSWDHGAAIGDTLSLCVPFLADWCRVDVITPEGGTRQLTGTVHVRLDVQQLERAGCGEQAVKDVYSTRKARIAQPTADERAGGVTEAILMPLLAYDVIAGVLTMVAVESRPSRHYGPEEIALVEALAGRIAVAIVVGDLRSQLARLTSRPTD